MTSETGEAARLKDRANQVIKKAAPTAPKLNKKELNRLKELLAKGNQRKDLPQDEMLETIGLLRKAGITPMTLLGSLLKKSNVPSFRLLGEIIA